MSTYTNPYNKFKQIIDLAHREGHGTINGKDLGVTSIPPELFMPKSLRVIELDLSLNKLSALPPQIGTLTGLKHLYFEGNLLRELPSQICHLINLETIAIDDNPLPIDMINAYRKGNYARPPQRGRDALPFLEYCWNQTYGPDNPNPYSQRIQEAAAMNAPRPSALPTLGPSLIGLKYERAPNATFDSALVQSAMNYAPTGVFRNGISPTGLDIQQTMIGSALPSFSAAPYTKSKKKKEFFAMGGPVEASTPPPSNPSPLRAGHRGQLPISPNFQSNVACLPTAAQLPPSMQSNSPSKRFSPVPSRTSPGGNLPGVSGSSISPSRRNRPNAYYGSESSAPQFFAGKEMGPRTQEAWNYLQQKQQEANSVVKGSDLLNDGSQQQQQQQQQQQIMSFEGGGGSTHDPSYQPSVGPAAFANTFNADAPGLSPSTMIANGLSPDKKISPSRLNPVNMTFSTSPTAADNHFRYKKKGGALLTNANGETTFANPAEKFQLIREGQDGGGVLQGSPASAEPSSFLDQHYLHQQQQGLQQQGKLARSPHDFASLNRQAKAKEPQYSSSPNFIAQSSPPHKVNPTMLQGPPNPDYHGALPEDVPLNPANHRPFPGFHPAYGTLANGNENRDPVRAGPRTNPDVKARDLDTSMNLFDHQEHVGHRRNPGANEANSSVSPSQMLKVKKKNASLPPAARFAMTNFEFAQSDFPTPPNRSNLPNQMFKTVMDNSQQSRFVKPGKARNQLQSHNVTNPYVNLEQPTPHYNPNVARFKAMKREKDHQKAMDMATNQQEQFFHVPQQGTNGYNKGPIPGTWEDGPPASQMPPGVDDNIVNQMMANNSGPGFRSDSVVHFTEDADLIPVQMPTHTLNNAIGQIASNDWRANFEACDSLRSLAIHHSDVLQPHLSAIIPKVTSLVLNLRTELAQNAMLCLSCLCRCLQSNMDPYLGIILHSLIKRAAFGSSVLAGVALQALQMLVSACTGPTVFPAVFHHLKDKDARSKAVCCNALAMCIQAQQDPSFLFYRQFLSDFLREVGPALYEGSEVCRNAAATALTVLIQRAKQSHQLMPLQSALESANPALVDRLNQVAAAALG
mmetsp:Transcript_29923/g.58672  ORF Transcript_29923/g.58672 Transcript_29923/m.58672 type:complete len:1083 (+) Transcript_29923:67-3315(+)